MQNDIWETETESPFPGLTTHAYLLTRPDGNVLFYNTGHRHEIEQMAALGGVVFQFLSHRDELGDTINLLHERFGTRLGGHVREQAEFARVGTLTRARYSQGAEPHVDSGRRDSTPP